MADDTLRRTFQQQTDMTFQAVEKCLNMYSRDRKKAREYANSEQKQEDLVQNQNSSDDILNSGV
jgi:uridine kinase